MEKGKIKKVKDIINDIDNLIEVLNSAKDKEYTVKYQYEGDDGKTYWAEEKGKILYLPTIVNILEHIKDILKKNNGILNSKEIEN